MKAALIFPIYNEETSIYRNLEEIIGGLENFDCNFILIDDASTDSTSSILEELRELYSNVVVHRNVSNLGHGPTVVKGLQIALMQKPDLIISSDSDGEVKLQDFQKAIQLFQDLNFQLLEGVRRQRSSDFLRLLVSAIARLIVFIKSGGSSQDANTPFRAYKPEVLERILSSIPKTTLIPNIWISIYARKFDLKPFQIDLYPNTSVQSAFLGSSWKSKSKLASRIKFLRFAFKSFKQIIKY